MTAQPEVLTLQAAASDGLCFTKAEILPRRALMLYQLRALIPGRGEVDVLAAPPLAEGFSRLDGGEGDFNGNAAFSMGAAFLAPFVNRIRGRHHPARREIETKILGRPVSLPANGGGKSPGAEQYAIHGLLLDKAVDAFTRAHVVGGEMVRAQLAAGDFDGRWLSSTEFTFEVQLTAQVLTVAVTARNAGTEVLPIGLGWHPYFNIPSGERAQARLRLPASSRLPVNNYDEVLPTGEIWPVSGPYDFRNPVGRALSDLYLDDCFVGLEKTAVGETVCELADPVAGYGLRISSSSPEITAVQTFAPPDRPFVVIEPQFSWADPYGAQWKEGVDTGMVLLQPSETVEYKVELRLFEPGV